MRRGARTDTNLELVPNSEWKVRQGRRLGLTGAACSNLFHPRSSIWKYDGDGNRYSMVLRQLEKELSIRDAGNFIDVGELRKIAEEALA